MLNITLQNASNFIWRHSNSPTYQNNMYNHIILHGSTHDSSPTEHLINNIKKGEITTIIIEDVIQFLSISNKMNDNCESKYILTLLDKHCPNKQKYVDLVSCLIDKYSYIQSEVEFNNVVINETIQIINLINKENPSIYIDHLDGITINTIKTNNTVLLQSIKTNKILSQYDIYTSAVDNIGFEAYVSGNVLLNSLTGKMNQGDDIFSIMDTSYLLGQRNINWRGTIEKHCLKKYSSGNTLIVVGFQHLNELLDNNLISLLKNNNIHFVNEYYQKQLENIIQYIQKCIYDTEILKNKGNELFKSCKYKEALELYKSGLTLLLIYSYAPSDYQKNKLLNMALIFMSNLVICFKKIKNQDMIKKFYNYTISKFINKYFDQLDINLINKIKHNIQNE